MSSGGAHGILSEGQRKRYAMVFVELDTNADGWMSREECGHWLKGAGYTDLSERQMETIFRLIDVNEDGRITLDEFFKIMELTHQPPSKNSEARKSFQCMDRDGDGYLTMGELHTGLNNSGYSLTRTQVDKFVANMDTNHDGKISYEEFLQAFQ